MSIYQQYLAKMAADEGFDPILQHPNMAAKPHGLDAMSDRKKKLHTAISLGGMGGALVGGLGAHAAANYVLAHAPEDVAAVIRAMHKGYFPITGAAVGLTLGASMGVAAAGLHSYVAKVQRHHEAANAYEARTSTSLPMDVRHPYLSRFAPTLIGTAVGAAAGHYMGRGAATPMDRMASRAIGSTVGSLFGAVANPGAAALMQDRRDQLFRGRVSQKILADSVLDEDTLDQQALQGS